jgi:hypothetical protein
MFQNYLKEIYLDSDTKVACISGAPSEVPEDWFLTNEMKAQARADVNGLAKSRRMFAHAIFTPGYDGWMEQIDHAIRDLKPDSMKGYTIGDNTNKNLSKHAWRLDDEKLVYPAYEKFLKAGLKNVCIHKGLFPPSVEKQFPHLLEHSDVRDVGKAAKDWPSSTSSSTTAATVGREAATCRTRGRSSSRPGGSNGSPISPRFRRSSA